MNYSMNYSRPVLPKELSTMTQTLCICAAHTAALVNMRLNMTSVVTASEELNWLFYVSLSNLNLNLNSHMWLCIGQHNFSTLLVSRKS